MWSDKKQEDIRCFLQFKWEILMTFSFFLFLRVCDGTQSGAVEKVDGRNPLKCSKN